MVAYVGTFSKTMLPQLRLGYAVLPPAILGAVIKAKRLTDCHTSTLPQWALAKFIAEVTCSSTSAAATRCTPGAASASCSA